MSTKRPPVREAPRKSAAPTKPATGETAASIKRFEKRYSGTLERLAKR